MAKFDQDYKALIREVLTNGRKYGKRFKVEML